MSLERVLIATDLTEGSLAIARSGIELARSHGAETVVFHAVSPLTNLPLAEDTRAGWLEGTVSTARQKLAGVEHATIEVLVGPPVDAIRARAESMKADLVILGARATDDPWRMLVGSTSLQVVRELSCPALITRAPLESSRFVRPLVAVDFSELSRPAIHCAAALSEAGATIELIHVIETDAVPEQLADVALQSRAKLLERLDTFVREVDLATVPIKTRTELGRVADQILEVVGLAHCDLIVVGARRKDRPQVVLGSIADRVLRVAATPVLVVQP